MSCISVVRIGGDSSDMVSVELLKQALCSHFEADDRGVITCSNKYFTARVAFYDIGVVADEGNEIPLKEDGMFLVFADSVDSTSSSSVAAFQKIQPLHDRAQELEQAGDLLRLCVGVRVGERDIHTKTSKEYEEEYSRRVLWCLDHGYEYVEADLSEHGVRAGHDEREKDGFARIVEAISETVWSSAVMTNKKKTELKQQYAEDKPREDTKIVNPYEPPDPSKLPPITASVGETKQDMERNKKAREVILGQSGMSATESSSDRFLDNGQQERLDVQQRQQEREEEQFMNEFEGALRQATQIRDLSRSGALSDDERRQRAGDAAMLLMGLMGKTDRFDDEDDEDDEVPSS